MRVLFLVVASSSLVASDAGAPAPLQYFYRASTASEAAALPSGCTRSAWRPPRGVDAAGISGPPFVSTVDCTNATGGFALAGALRAGGGGITLYLASAGALEVNGRSLTVLGSAYWAQDGQHLNFTLSKGSTLVAVGAPLELDPSRRAAQVAAASYRAPLERWYLAQDALANDAAARAANVNDTHINNGAANARDLTWSSTTQVEPTHLVVLNCELNGSTVADHLHPWGAMYIPFSGRICFEHPKGTFECVRPGESRWVSPLLRYLETFEAEATPNAAASDLVARAGMADCSGRPIVFAVSNFDADDDAGVPNFVDIPDPTKPMVVRSTYVRSVAIEWPDVDDDEA